MPLMVEPLVMQANNARGGYMVDGDINRILPLVRQAVELGADIIKADPCDDVSEYHRVIEIAAGKPVLVRGGGKVPDREILQRTYDLMQQGAKGIVYGRNVIQHEHPAAMTLALMAVVHDGATPDAALRHIEEAAHG
jgi:DhnA family fructose-bisphosphate aldolase class Ia